MLDFVKNAFRTCFSIILWLNVIFCTIGGGVLANMTYSAGRYGSHGIHPVVGGILGLIAGLIIDIVAGGLIATILNIDENLETLTGNSYRTGNSSGGNSSGINLSDVPPVNRNYGDTWTCKECNEKNPITSSTCKGCGAYK